MNFRTQPLPLKSLYTMYSFLSFTFLVATAHSQHIFINLVPEYSSLSSCAQTPISTIVRDMENGCGDSNATTSYSCFCTASSSYFNSLISSAVNLQCNGYFPEVQASSATEVFHSYCEVGATTSQATSMSMERRGNVILGLISNTVTSSQASPTSSGTSSPAAPASTASTSSLLPTNPTTSAPPPAQSGSTVVAMNMISLLTAVLIALAVRAVIL